MSILAIGDLKHEKSKIDISLSDLSEKCGVSEATLSKLFSGKADNPTIGTLCDIATAMEMEIRAVKVGALDAVPVQHGVDETLLNHLIAEKNHRIDERDRTINLQRKYIVALFCTAAVLALILICYLIYDAQNGNWGLIQYMQDSPSYAVARIPGMQTIVRCF